MKKILDACCGSKMFWFDKKNQSTIYMDNRELTDVLCDGRTLSIKPDVVANFNYTNTVGYDKWRNLLLC